MSNIQSYSGNGISLLGAPTETAPTTSSGGLLGSLFGGSGGIGGILGGLLSPLTNWATRNVRGIVGSDYNAGAQFTTTGLGRGISGLLGNVVDTSSNSGLLGGVANFFGIGQNNLGPYYNANYQNQTQPTWNAVNVDNTYPNYGVQWTGSPFITPTPNWGFTQSPMIMPAYNGFPYVPYTPYIY